MLAHHSRSLTTPSLQPLSSDDIAAAIEEASEQFYDDLAKWLDDSVETREVLIHNQQIGELVRAQVQAHLQHM